jgi:hypothetical protein
MERYLGGATHNERDVGSRVPGEVWTADERYPSTHGGRGRGLVDAVTQYSGALGPAVPCPVRARTLQCDVSRWAFRGGAHWSRSEREERHLGARETRETWDDEEP